MNAITPSLFRSLLTSIRALPGSEQIVLEQMVRELSSRLYSDNEPEQTETPTEKVARLKRLRKADGIVMAVEFSALPAALLPDPEAIGDSLYAHLDAIGRPVVRALQHIRAINASADMAARVGIDTGTAMLLMTRIGYLADNTPIELTDTYCRDDYYDFVAELRR